VKSLPDGEPVQLTHDDFFKMSPVFSPDGTRIAYTSVAASFLWDTWTVGAAGGEPRRWLTNASALAWTSPRRVLFSEIRQTPHMAIVTADDSRANSRDVYVPVQEHGMAHRSYLSPDGRWVLLVEMDQDHIWTPCRLVPMDGGAPSRRVGPADAACTSGAWSPDGKWMYVTSDAGGVHHIWRQRFPDGVPEQVTSGPTEEQGIAMAIDGRSFITAVALQAVSIWLHDGKGERQISSVEGLAVNPKFTPDRTHLCYLIVKETPTLYAAQPGDLWIADVNTGRSVPVAPGLKVLEYDVSPDGRDVVMGVMDAAHKPRLWLQSIDRQAAPRQVMNVEGRQPKFGAAGDIFFRDVDYIYRVRQDGSGLRKALEQPILLLAGVSRDGRWVTGWSALPNQRGMAMNAISLEGRPSVQIGSQITWTWSPAGDVVSVSAGPIADPNRSYLIPLEHGQALPPIPPGGFTSEQQLADIPGARRIDAVSVPGPTPDVYAFYRGNSQRNLYRIAIP
jgi:Tol biopolymer transport system component